VLRAVVRNLVTFLHKPPRCPVWVAA